MISLSLLGLTLRKLSISSLTVAWIKAKGVGCAAVLEAAKEKLDTAAAGLPSSLYPSPGTESP